MISRDESFEHIWKRIIEINDEYKPQWRNWHGAMLGIGLAKEVGEVCDIISVWYRGGTNKKTQSTPLMALEEVVDIMVYGIMFLEMLDIDYDLFMEVFRQKLNIIEERLMDNKQDG